MDTARFGTWWLCWRRSAGWWKRAAEPEAPASRAALAAAHQLQAEGRALLMTPSRPSDAEAAWERLLADWRDALRGEHQELVNQYGWVVEDLRMILEIAGDTLNRSCLQTLQLRFDELHSRLHAQVQNLCSATEELLTEVDFLGMRACAIHDRCWNQAGAALRAGAPLDALQQLAARERLVEALDVLRERLVVWPSAAALRAACAAVQVEMTACRPSPTPLQDDSIAPTAAERLQAALPALRRLHWKPEPATWLVRLQTLLERDAALQADRHKARTELAGSRGLAMWWCQALQVRSRHAARARWSLHALAPPADSPAPAGSAPRRTLLRLVRENEPPA
jgi:hypothetical protein